jgi:O-antigen ligase
MKKTLATAIMISLTGNVFPVFNIAAIAGLFLLFFAYRDQGSLHPSQYGPHWAKRFLFAAYVFWLLSYVITGAPFSNLLSYDFLRFDGALLIAYLPLLLLTDIRLDPIFIRRTLGLFLTVMSIIALLGLAEFVDNTLVPLGLSRLPEPLQLLHNASLSTDIFQGFFRAHNAAGAIYAMSSCTAFSLLVLARNPSLISWPALWLCANVIGVVLTQSRTAYVAFLATLVCVFLRRGFLMNFVKIGSFVLLPLLYLLLIQPVVTKRTEAVANSEDPNIVLRFYYYGRALEDFVQSPIIGTGFGRFNDDLKIYSGIPHLFYIATGGAVVNDDSHAHNSYLHFLAEGGIVGLTLMLGIWLATLRWLVLVKDSFKQDSFGWMFAHGVQACVVLELFMSLTEHMMGTAVSSLTVFTMVGMLLNLVGWKYRLASLLKAVPVYTLPDQPIA